MVSGAEIAIFGLFLMLGIFVLAASVFWIWMLIHAISNKGVTDNEKLIWVLVIVFTHFIGALIYFFVGRPKQNAIAGTKPSPG